MRKLLAICLLFVFALGCGSKGNQAVTGKKSKGELVGVKGKKYKSAKFKNFLLSIKEEDMDTQRKLLDKEFEHWKASYEQVDDVCVMGVRV